MAHRSYASQVIPQVAEYFGEEYPLPIVVAAYRDKEAVDELIAAGNTGIGTKQGWQRAFFLKHVSRSWLRRLRANGYSQVRLAHGGREADFTIEELMR